MRIPAVLIVVLLFFLVGKGVVYAARTYLTGGQRALFTVYFGFLIAFGWLVIHLTFRVMDLVQTARDIEVLEPTPYVRSRPFRRAPAVRDDQAGVSRSMTARAWG